MNSNWTHFYYLFYILQWKQKTHEDISPKKKNIHEMLKIFLKSIYEELKMLYVVETLSKRSFELHLDTRWEW